MTTTNTPASPAPSVKPIPPWDSPKSVILAAAWWGLLIGTVKALGFVTTYLLHATFVGNISPYLWTIPLIDAVVTGLLGLVFYIFARLFGVRPGLRATLTFFFCVVFVAASIIGVGTMVTRRLVLWASILLAIGVGVQAARFANRRPAFVHRLMVITAPLMIVLSLLLGAVIHGSYLWNQHKLLSTLPAAKDGAPNVLLIVMDTVRAQSLSLYGHPRPTTPNLEKWAARGVVFDNAVTAAPFTLNSHTAMFTGLYSSQFDADWYHPLGDKYPVLAQVLHDNGYYTVGVAANCSLLGVQTGLNRGFAWYTSHVLGPVNLLVSAITFNYSHSREMESAQVNARLLDWIDNDNDGAHPFFAFLNYNDCHSPYHLPMPEDTTDPAAFKRRQKTMTTWCENAFKATEPPTNTEMIKVCKTSYETCIHNLDSDINSLLAGLEMRGLLKNTIVIIVADHGEQFGEHGLVQHADSVYHPAIHVPLIIIPPNCPAAGRRVEQLVTLRDLPSTILDLLKLDHGGISGDSMASAMGADPNFKLPDAPIYSYISKGIVLSRWHPNSRAGVGAVFVDNMEYMHSILGNEMYDWMKDPLEQNNLVDSPEYSDQVKKCQQLLAGEFPDMH